MGLCRSREFESKKAFNEAAKEYADERGLWGRQYVAEIKRRAKIIRKAMPSWIAKLEEADFNIDNLPDECNRIIRCDANLCLIGELQGFEDNYTDLARKATYCRTCEVLCQVAPAILRENASKSVLNLEQFWAILADHIELAHPEMMNHKKQNIYELW